MRSLSEKVASFVGKCNQLLLPEIDLLPQPVEAILYWCSACLLIVTSLACSAFPFSAYPEAIASFTGSKVGDGIMFLPGAIAPLFILPGLCLFVFSQVLSTSRRPWKLIIGLVLSHFIVGGLAVVLAFAAVWCRSRCVEVTR